MFQITSSMCARGSTVALHFCLNWQQSQNTHGHTHEHTDSITIETTTRTLHLAQSNWCRSSIAQMWRSISVRMRKKMPNFDTWQTHAVAKCDKKQCNGPLCVSARLPFDDRSNLYLSFSPRICINTVSNFNRVCIYDFFIFSLWYTYKLANKMADRGHLYFLRLYFFNWIQIKRSETFQLLIHVLFSVCSCLYTHTRIHTIRIHVCARTHAQMKMRNEIRMKKTSTMKKKIYEIHTQIACIVDTIYNIQSTESINILPA